MTYNQKGRKGMNSQNHQKPFYCLMYSFLFLSLLAGFGCAGHVPSIKEGEAEGEKLLWASQPKQPEWIYKEPPQEKGYLTFVGLSKDHATQQESRKDALRNAQNKVVEYIGTLAKSKFEKISSSYSVSSKIIDPTNATRDYEKYFAANFASQVKEKEAYVEKWLISEVIAWRSFLLTKVPEAVINKSLQNFAKENANKAQAMAKEAETGAAREQAQMSNDFFKEMGAKPLLEE